MTVNNIDINAPVLSFIGVLVTILINYVIHKNRKLSEDINSEKRIISEEQRDLKDAILSELNTCRDNVLNLQRENRDLQKRLLDERENKIVLNEKIAELKFKITELRHNIELIMEKVSNSV